MLRWSGALAALTLAACSGNAVKPISNHPSTGTNAAGGSSATTSGGASNSTGSTGATTSGTSSAGTTSGTTSASTGASNGSSSTTGASSSGSSGATTTTSGSSTGSTGSGGSSGSSGASTNSGTSGSTSASGSSGSSGSSGASGGTTGTAQAQVRVVDLVYNQTVAIDFCTKPTGTSTWSAPVLGAFGGSLTYPSATLYLSFDDPSGGAGTSYDVAVILASAGSCNLSTLFTTTFVARAGSLRTVVAAGSVTAPDFSVLTDDAPPTNGTDTAFRFTNAAPDPNITAADLGAPSGGSFREIFANIVYGFSSTQSSYQGNTGSVDGNGFLVRPAVGSIGFAARDHANHQQLATVSDTLDANQQRSLFLSGTNNAGFKLSSCVDDPSLVADSSNKGLDTCQ